MTDWTAVARRNARSVQTTVGWIFWDPGAVARYRDAGPAGGTRRAARLHRRPARPRWRRRPRRRHRRLRLDQPAGHRRRLRPARRRRVPSGCGTARDEAVAEGLAAPRPRHPRSPWPTSAPSCGRWWTRSRSSGGCSSRAHLALPRPGRPGARPDGTPSTASASGGATPTGRSSSPPGSPMPRRRSCTTPGSATRTTGWPGPAGPRRRPSSPAGGRPGGEGTGGGPAPSPPTGSPCASGSRTTPTA